MVKLLGQDHALADLNDLVILVPASSYLSTPSRSCMMLNNSDWFAFRTREIPSCDAPLPIAAEFEIRKLSFESVICAEHEVPFPFICHSHTNSKVAA